MRAILVTTFTAMIFVFGQQVAVADDKHKENLARQIVQHEEFVEALLGFMTPYINDIVELQLSHLDSSDDRADLVQLRNYFLQEMRRSKKELEDMITGIYARNLSLKALQGALDFYKTPAGQEFVQKRSRIEAEAEVLFEIWIEGLLERSFER